ncbi:LytR C-terminal domain-containing protein [Miltoncostaea marina]|uniref:LytR C-terminal domain-containing protein n=1 Tax=Miltoncostaea marina TaxID=2843215 RepID=UPI001C3D6415|nr:LytR C-terminal domain-containing protein [Miltoncostaea marina]
MSSRRPPEWDEDDWGDRDATPRRRGGRRPGRTNSAAPRFGVLAVAAALVGGLFVGWVANSGGGGTATVTETRTVTAPVAGVAAASAGVTPSPATARATIALAVLNGSDESGLAAAGAGEARALGYQRVTEGNAPAPVAADIVLHREGAAPQAARVAMDLGLPAPELVVDGDPVLTVAPDADVYVILGPTGGAGAAEGTTGPATEEPATTAPAAG